MNSQLNAKAIPQSTHEMDQARFRVEEGNARLAAAFQRLDAKIDTGIEQVSAQMADKVEDLRAVAGRPRELIDEFIAEKIDFAERYLRNLAVTLQEQARAGLHASVGEVDQLTDEWADRARAQVTEVLSETKVSVERFVDELRESMLAFAQVVEKKPFSWGISFFAIGLLSGLFVMGRLRPAAKARRGGELASPGLSRDRIAG